jgi:nucleoid-associated protein YgaU
MRLKEAQTLGILGLIAVLIVLVFMWGEEDEVDPAASAEAGQPAAEGADESLVEIYDELLFDEEAATSGPDWEEPVPATTVQIGGAGEQPEQAPSEEATIRTMIEEIAPAQIPLTPPEPATEPEPEEQSEPVPRPERRSRPRPRFHVVQKGDTVSEISSTYYGTSRKWRKILEANGMSEADARLLRPGMKLKIPPLQNAEGARVAASGSATPALSASARDESARTYTVKKGDTLYRIAKRCYSDGSRWKEIHEANSQRLPDPHKLRPGMELIIP